MSESKRTMETPKTHINPKFLSGNTGNQVHVNPNFIAKKNPNTAGRSLPAIPSGSHVHVNPNFIVDPAKTKAYEAAIKKAVQGQLPAADKKVFVNPKFQASLSSIQSSSSSSEKENDEKKVIQSPSTKAAKDHNSMATPRAKKSIFKMIGTRKLVRVNTPVMKKSSPISPPKTAPPGSFKKLGKRKLVRMRSASGSKMTPTSAKRRNATDVYKVKTRQKIVKVTPTKTNKTPIRKLLFSTPFSAKLKKSKLTPFASVLSQFKVDRRKAMAAKKKLNVEPEVPVSKPVPETKKPSTPAPPKPARKAKPSTTLINVQGVRYSVSDNGRKLKRLPPAEKVPAEKAPAGKAPNVPAAKVSMPPPRPSISQPRYQSLRKKFYLEGEEYVEDEPGILIRSRNSMTRASITSYKARSINTILKSQTRSRQYCMFFNKFGKCNKKEKGICPYIHDPEKVAVCRKFLNGTCVNLESCLLSHKVAPEKMPSCKFFLEGNCTREPCPYRHVKVNDGAEVCQDFLKGFCARGAECRKKHEEKTKVKKRAPPAKPKRKSMVLTETPKPEVEAAASRPARYYDDKIEENHEADDEGEAAAATADLEAKRQRLMKQIELAKQARRSDVEDPFPELESPNDSGPYEKIDEEREPLGPLPSYIALASSESDDEMLERIESGGGGGSKDIVLEAEENCDERLI